eukprot:6811599-Ditylum_brightwellii.AAC.1
MDILVLELLPISLPICQNGAIFHKAYLAVPVPILTGSKLGAIVGDGGCHCSSVIIVMKKITGRD